MAASDMIVNVKLDTSHIQTWLDTYLPDLAKCAIVDCPEKAQAHNRIEAALDTTGIGWTPRVRAYLCDKHYEDLSHLKSEV